VELLKSDVQGLEYVALEGMRKTLAAHQDIGVITEFWPEAMRKTGADPAEFLAMFAALGFGVWRIGGGQLLTAADPVELRRLAGNEQCDLLFLRSHERAARLSTG